MEWGGGITYSRHGDSQSPLWESCHSEGVHPVLGLLPVLGSSCLCLGTKTLLAVLCYQVHNVVSEKVVMACISVQSVSNVEGSEMHMHTHTCTHHCV